MVLKGFVPQWSHIESTVCLVVLGSQCYTRPRCWTVVLEGFGIYMIGILDSPSCVEAHHGHSPCNLTM